MLVTLKEILKIADEKKCAIGSFNTPNLEAALAVIDAAEKLNQPVIMMHAEIHEELMPLDVIGPIMIMLAKKAKVPVCVHLDHGTDLDYLKKALEIGFTSIMYDGSVLDYETNFKDTCTAVEMAKAYGASVEAEIGVMTRKETASESDKEAECENEDTSMYTNPAAAKEFAEDTGIDALACAFGTAHGLYTKNPKLDFNRLCEIKSLVEIPFVMHGGSGISHADYRKAIECGIRKINYYTYMAKAGGDAVKENVENLPFFHDVVTLGIKAMSEDVGKAIKAFSMK